MDHDVIRQPPRKAKDPIITRHLIINVIISAMIIVSGTLWVFWREVSVCHIFIKLKLHVSNRVFEPPQSTVDYA